MSATIKVVAIFFAINTQPLEGESAMSKSPSNGGAGSGSSTRECGIPGCNETTRELKPYCPDHVDDNPYVQEIINALSANKKEQDNVLEKGPEAVDLEGMTASAIRLLLTNHGARTVERLSRDLSLEATIVKKYVDSLVNEGQVTLGRTTRGSTIVRIKEDAA